MGSNKSEFEVRCSRCDVTFPVGTGACIHCGGATSASHTGPSTGGERAFGFDPGSGSSSSFGTPFEDEFDGGIEEAGEGEWESRYDDAFESVEDGSNPIADQPERSWTEEPDAETPNVGRSILGSMGSLIWIVMLIAFSLSRRVCGE